MDIDPQHRKTLQDVEVVLTNSAAETAEMKDYYEAEFDSLSEDERETENGEALQKLITELEEICDRLDLTIIDVGALLSQENDMEDLSDWKERKLDMEIVDNNTVLITITCETTEEAYKTFNHLMAGAKKGAMVFITIPNKEERN